MSSRAVCLCVGFYRPGTGLSRVMETITKSLSTSFEFHLIGIGYKGPEFDNGVRVYPCNLYGGDVYGAIQLKQRILELSPNTVFLLNDLWMLANYESTFKAIDYKPRCVAYVAIDGKITDSNLVNRLGFIDELVAYTEFAKQGLTAAFANNTEYDFLHAREPKLSVIPHGVDRNVFHPCSDHSTTLSTLLNHHNLDDDGFIVLNANRPHVRKRFDLTIKAFAKFALAKPKNVTLIIHSSIISELERENIQSWAVEQGVSERVFVTAKGSPFLSDQRLNHLYNLCSVGINTSMGEGWGMVSFEHAAAGKAQIVPSHSACKELWQGVAQLIETSDSSVTEFSPLELEEISVDSAAEQLEMLYKDDSYREAQADKCLKFVSSGRFDWHTIALQWKKLFDTE